MSKRSVADILDDLFPDDEGQPQEQAPAPTNHGKPTAADIEAATEDNTPLVLGQTIKDEPRAKATTNNNDPDARAEVAEMQQQAPLLDAIRDDTGEQGKGSGDYIAFRTCPVCGHSDDFRFYPSSNTWACYGGSNPNQNANGCEVGGYLEYMQRARNMTPTEAMKQLRDVTGHDYRNRAGKVDPGVGKPGANGSGADLGEAIPWGDESERDADSAAQTETKRAKFDALDKKLVHTDQLTGENRRPKPKYIIDGLISECSVNMIAAPSKQCKSWAALSMCWSVANGTPWMGHFECNRGRVLYVDIELGENWLSQRLDDVRRRERHADGFMTISLKGDVYTSLDDLRQWLTSCHPNDFDLIVIDPLYLFEQGEENAAETWIPIMVQLGGIQAGCSCAVVYVHHFSKGWPNAMPENRPAGSGVIGRYYEQAILFTPRTLDVEARRRLEDEHGKNARVYEFVTSSRNYGEADIESVVWSWPSFHADTEHAYDGFPITGTKEAAKIAGGVGSSERSEELRVLQDKATSQAVELTKAEGLPTTRANVMRHLETACEFFGISVPSKATFRNWTLKGGPTHWRVDQSRGNELHAIDVDRMDEDGNAPFLPMPDDV